MSMQGALTDMSAVMAPPLGPIRFAAGTTVFEEGDHGDCAYMIEEGHVEVSSRDANSKTVLAILGPGELFGEMALLDGQQRSATATVMHESRLIIITQDQVKDAVASASPLARLILMASVNRLRSTNPSHSIAAHKTEIRERKAELDKAYNAVRDAAAYHVRLRTDLEIALANEMLELAYQPIFRLKDGRTAGFEALIRWPRPDGKPVSPAEFVPLAEECGLIVPLGVFALDQGIAALNKLEQMHNARHPAEEAVFVSVNVSPRQLLCEENIERLANMIEQTCVNPANLKLEITEQSLLSDPKMAGLGLGRLKATGVTVAIDDFGTGYSSLNYLHRFPLDTLKIDRSFVQKLASDRDGQRIVSAIIGLATDLGMDVVAEGIEHMEEFLWLQSRGCHFAQGYLMAKPLPLREAITHIGRSFEW